MAITLLQPSQTLPPPSPAAPVAPVTATVSNSEHEAQNGALRREVARLANLETLVTPGSTLAGTSGIAQTGLAPDISTMLSAALEANPQENDANATKAFLSLAGRLIGQLLQLTQNQNLPVSVLGKNPILASPPKPGDTPQTAMALKNTLELSGLFYESHLAEWANNERTLASVMQEPQAQPTDLQPSTKTTGVLPAHPNTALDNVNSSLALIIGQQLNVLEQNRIAWEGDIWPGQPMAWEVGEDTREEGRGEREEAPQEAWRSDLRFDLPNLGTVAAKVYWAGGRVQVQVRVAHEPAASSLRTHGAQLANALDSAGFKLDALQVQIDVPT
ncbi:MAG: flagellar hook-length control protein FliK [Candidatus Methylumidiphilus sp.]